MQSAAISEDTSDLKRRTLHGGIAKMGSQGASFLLRIVSLMVLARLLDPADFGVVGMVTAVTGIFALFKDAGLSVATVQRKAITDNQVSTLFWLNIAVGLALGLLTVAIAPAIAAFYREPRLFWVTVAVAAGFVCNAAGVQHSALLQRQMRFTTLAVIDVLSLLSGIAAGVVMALYGYGYWALVALTVLPSAVSAIGFWLTTRWIPSLPTADADVRSMIRFGGIVTINGVIVYFAYNVEKILLGRFWGADALGLYGRAYQLISIPADNVNSAGGGVVFSALSRLQDDPERLKRYFLKSYSLVLELTLPATIACGLFADDIITVLLGQKWAGATPIFRLLTPTFVVFAMINPFSWFLWSSGLLSRSVRLAMVIAPLVIVAEIIGLPYGPTGVAFAYSAATTLWLIPHLAWCIHGTILKPSDLVKTIGKPLISALVAGGIGYAVVNSYPQALSHLTRLIIEGSVMLVAYLAILMYVMGERDFHLELVENLRGRSTRTVPVRAA